MEERLVESHKTNPLVNSVLNSCQVCAAKYIAIFYRESMKYNYPAVDQNKKKGGRERHYKRVWEAGNLDPLFPPPPCPLPLPPAPTESKGYRNLAMSTPCPLSFGVKARAQHTIQR